MTKRKLNNKIKKVRVSSKRVFYIRFRPVAQKWFFPIVFVIFSVACIDHWYSNRGTWVFENASAAVYEETNLIETAQPVSGGLGVNGTMANTTASVAVPTGGMGVNEVALGPNSLMQSTGLKDKNGKEIYEGDIRCGKYYFETEEQTRFQVMKWDEKNTCFYWDGPEIPGFIDVEVIGNIYENPELIEPIRS